MKTISLIGRTIFGRYFLYNGINHLLKRKELAQYAESKHVSNPEAAVVLSGLALLFGGTSIILGKKPKLGAAAVAGFLAAVSPVMHNFWDSGTPEQKLIEFVNFTKNMALLGATLGMLDEKKPWAHRLAASSPTRLINDTKTALVG